MAGMLALAYPQFAGANTADPLLESRAHAQTAESYQSQGRPQLAVEQLKQALQLASETDDKRWQAILNAQLGGALLSLDQLIDAGNYLTTALEQASVLHDAGVEASIRNNIGYLLLRQDKPAEATAEYRKTISLAGQAGNNSLLAKAALSAAEIEIKAGNNNAAAPLIETSWQAITRLEPSHDSVYLVIRNARVLLQAAESSQENPEWISAAASRLQQAAQTAESMGDQRAASYAYGYLGELYEQQQRYEDALALTDTAIFLSQQIYAPEIRYQWEWQAARLNNALGRPDTAIEIYRRAAATLQSIRAEFTASNEEIAAAYRDDAGPMFLEMADLLLRQSEAANDSDQEQALLREARETVELLKTTELQNYFEDDCVTAVRAKIKELDDTIVPGTAILYPITLTDRTELLVSLPGGLIKYSVPIGMEELLDTVHRFRQRLEKRTTRQYMRQAIQLYKWLIKPLEAELKNHNIDTLVVVPDAALRGVPVAAFHDGKDFLIRRYAVAMTPSLRLTDPRPIKRENITLLLNGLTESVQGFPPLEHVSTELEAIQDLYGGKVLQNETYKKDSVRRELIENQYSIVHFATHGQFSGKVKNSFILAYDEKISMDDLEEFVGVSWFRDDRPVELLTLSACETASGDDTAALGLASVAIKAGARSALASLWSINDEASSKLVSVFYEQLRNPGTSKAVALQQAQVRFLDDLRYRHPSYWAPFLLIGNWL